MRNKIRNACMYLPLPLVGEGGGEGEYTLPTPTSILPLDGGGSCFVIFMVRACTPKCMFRHAGVGGQLAMNNLFRISDFSATFSDTRPIEISIFVCSLVRDSRGIRMHSIPARMFGHIHRIIRRFDKPLQVKGISVFG